MTLSIAKHRKKPVYYKPRTPVLKKIWDYKVLYLFLLPGFVLLVVFTYIPMLGQVMTFQKYDPIDGFFGSPWVGLENFKTLFTSSPTFTNALKNDLFISTLKLVILTPLPIIFALLLNELRLIQFKKTVQSISYLPNFISWVIAAGIWYQLLSVNTGVVNQILISLGILQEGFDFLINPAWFYAVLILSEIWKNLGFSTILYLGAIASADVQLYEAAVVDGAGRIAQARYITLPAMKSIIVMLFILSVSNIVGNAGFDQIVAMQNAAVLGSSDILDTAVLRILKGGGTISSLSIGAAMGTFKSVIGLTLFYIANKVSKKLVGQTLV